MNPQTQQPPIDWTSGDHGVVLNDGTKIPYNQLQQTDPQLYSQYLDKIGQPQAGLQQTQTSTQATKAQIPGIQASSTKEQIQAQQASSPQNLSHDLSSKMTLPSALKKYTSLGMNADDVFKQYLAESPWGMPNQTPTELQSLGVSADALGKIGTPGSFMDRYNTKNAIAGLRTLEGLWNKTSTSSRLAGMVGLNSDTAAYDAARQIFGEHLSSLIPGASGAQGSVNDLLNTLPSSGDLTENTPGKATAKFGAVENQLIASKGYSYKDLSLPPHATTNQQQSSASAPAAKGGDLLTNLLSNAGKDVVGDVQGLAKNAIDNQSMNPVQMALDANDNAKGLVSEYGSLISDPMKHLQEHPVNTALDVVGPLLGLKGMVGDGGVPPETGGGADTAINNPSALQKIFSPGKIKEQAGAARDSVVKQSSQGGNMIPGDNIVSQLQNWAQTIGKPGNPGQGAKIDNIVNEAQQQYAGKQINPLDALKIYNEVDSGFNTKGLQKDAIQSRGDIALRQILRGELEKAAPGFDKLTNIIGQGYQAEKSKGAQIVKNLPQNAVRAGLNAAGLGVLREFFGF